MGLYDQFTGGSSSGGGSNKPTFTGKIIDKDMPLFKTTNNNFVTNAKVTVANTPESQKFALPASMTLNPYYFNGSVYILNSKPPFDFMRMNIQTGQLEVLPNFPHAYPNYTGVTTGIIFNYNDRLYYILTGISDSDRIYVFNTDTLQWESSIMFSTVNAAKRSSPAFVFDNDSVRLYLLGGYNTTASTIGVSTLTCEYYDFNTQAWTTIASLPAAKTLGSGAVINGKVYALYGSTTATYEYTPGTNTWATKVAASANPGSNSSNVYYSIPYNNKIYTAGNNGIYVYDPTANTYTSVTNIPALTISATEPWSINLIVNADSSIDYYRVDTGSVFKVNISLTGAGTGGDLLFGNHTDVAISSHAWDNNYTRVYNNKIYYMYGGSVSFIPGRYLFEKDITTGIITKIPFPDGDSYNANSFMFIYDEKLYIFVYYKNTPITNTAFQSIVIYDLVEKTFTTNPMTLPTIPFDGIFKMMSYKDKIWFYHTNTGSSSSRDIRIFDPQTFMFVVPYSGTSSSAFFYIDETKEIMYFSYTSANIYYKIDMNDFTTLNSTMNTTGITIPNHIGMIIKDTFIYLFTATGTVDIYDMTLQKYYLSKITNNPIVASHNWLSDGWKMVDTNGAEYVPNVLQILYTSPSANILKLIKGEIIVYDELDNLIGFYSASNNYVDIPVGPGFKIKHFANKPVVLG